MLRKTSPNSQRKETFAKAKAIVMTMKQILSNAEKKTIGGWDAPCETIDYRKLAESARQQCEFLRARLWELNHGPLARRETELSRRRTVRILTDMYYEQKSNCKLFEMRAIPRESRGEQAKTAGEAKSSASPANAAYTKKKTAQTNPSSQVPPVKSEAMAERLLASLTGRKPSQQKKPPVPGFLPRQDGMQGRR